MHIRLLLLMLLFATTSCQSQQLSELNDIQSLRGKPYSDDSLPPLLKKYQFIESSQASAMNDEEQFAVYVYRLHNDYLVFFTLNNTKGNKIVQDVLSIAGVKEQEEVKTVLCWEGAVNNVELVAVVNPKNEQHTKAERVWRFNRDKRKFEVHTAKNVSCLNEGYSG